MDRIFSQMSETGLSEQCTFAMGIHEIEAGVQALRDDTRTMTRGRTLANTIGDGETSSDGRNGRFCEHCARASGGV